MAALEGLVMLTVTVFSICASSTTVQFLSASGSDTWNTALVWRSSEAWGPGREERESGDPAIPRKVSSREAEKRQAWNANLHALNRRATAGVHLRCSRFPTHLLDLGESNHTPEIKVCHLSV